MRSALTLLDKCLAYSPDVTVSNVINVIGVAGWDDMFDLLTAVKNKDDKSCLEIINNNRRNLKAGYFVEQGTGVEPALTAWEAAVIPIYQPCAL